jgi:protein O-mannosyl-transferase
MLSGPDLIKKKLVIIVILFLAVAILVVYWQVQFYDFTNYDDPEYVTENYQIQQGFSLESIVYCFTDIHTGHWHPLTMISHMLDWQLFGNRAGGHHWTSVIIHIFNTVLLFLFFKTITGTIWRSAVVAALFAIHPINVDSVAWVAERKNVLSTFFWIFTMILYVWYIKSPSWKRYLPVIFCFILGLMSKAILVTLPFVLLLLDYWPLERTNISRQNMGQTATGTTVLQKEKVPFLILEKIPLFILSAVSVFVAMYTAVTRNTLLALEKLPIMKRVANLIVSYGLYIKKMFWPVNLAVFYPLNFNIPYWHIVLAASLLIIITIFVCVYFRKYPYLPVGWFWYLGTMFPMTGIIQSGAQAMADRYAYVPFVGLFIILVWGTFDILKKRISTEKMIIISAGIIVGLIITAYYQVKFWENSYTLWQQTIRVTSAHYIPHKNIGLYLTHANRPQEAMYYLQKAMELKKNDAELHNSLGVVLSMMGKDIEAMEQYKKALRLQPTYARAYNNLGVILARLGKSDEAAKYFREAIRLKFKYPNAHFGLANILKQKGLNKEAAYHYQEAMRIEQTFKYGK